MQDFVVSVELPQTATAVFRLNGKADRPAPTAAADKVGISEIVAAATMNAQSWPSTGHAFSSGRLRRRTSAFGPLADWQLSGVEVGIAAVRDRPQATVVDQYEPFR
jgi:hypothetical protein